MNRLFIIGSLILLLLLASCTTTPQGKSIDRANYADMGSTGIALATVEGAAEANPLGIALLPVKLGMGKWVEHKYPDDCYKRVDIAKTSNTVFYGATANNTAIMLGLSGPAAPIVGVIGGITYFAMRNKVEPNTFDCIPPELQALAKAYTDGDAEAFADAFTENGSANSAYGREAIAAEYREFFATSKKRQMWLLDWDGSESYSLVKVDKKSGYLHIEVEFEGDKISHLEYSDWLTYDEIKDKLPATG